MDKRELLTRYYEAEWKNWVGRINARGVPTREDAEDIVQWAFERALMFIDSYDPELSELSTWFTRIVNQVHGKARSNSWNLVEIGEDDIFTPPADEYEADKDLYEDIKRRIKKEPFQFRQVLWMYFLAGFKPLEISKNLDIKQDTVKKQIHRFKQKVRGVYG